MIATGWSEAGVVVYSTVEPLDETWRQAALAYPAWLRGQPGDPLYPFVAFLESRHRVGNDQALLAARAVRTLLKHFPIAELLAGDPREFSERLPFVDARRYVGGGRSQHGKRYRQAGYRLQEWAALRAGGGRRDLPR